MGSVGQELEAAPWVQLICFSWETWSLGVRRSEWSLTHKSDSWYGLQAGGISSLHVG